MKKAAAWVLSLVFIFSATSAFASWGSDTRTKCGKTGGYPEFYCKGITDSEDDDLWGKSYIEVYRDGKYIDNDSSAKVSMKYGNEAEAMVEAAKSSKGENFIEGYTTHKWYRSKTEGAFDQLDTRDYYPH
ncbi:hypothetical protein AV540_23795 [Brevibacillus parabrevis]|uniref:hypothetical protein n=1 Tax=Brevibacillus parabrevis TaxID=54914 RepID=UPI0007AC0348|nr:hypothetical protein [Brevibacillus parabrevis]KZE44662.1 hypothetical protein AV540_23795 [Brevibacillus parabrevis]